MSVLSEDILFSVFLLLAAWQDIRNKCIEIWVYLIFGIIAAVRLLLIDMQFSNMLAGILPGLVLLLAGRLSRGALGSGDGWFFVIAGGILGIQEEMHLLFFGILLCGIVSMGIYLSGIIRGKNRGKETVPFLPFLVPVWICMLIG